MTETPPANSIVPAEQSPRANGLQNIRVVQDVVPVFDTGRFEHLQRIATGMADCTLLPESLTHVVVAKDKKEPLPYRQIVANAFLIVNQAVRWGMDPFAVAQCVSVIHGKLCYEGKLVHAVIEQKLGIRLAYTFNDAKDDKLAVVVSGVLPGETAARTVKGTVAGWRTSGSNSPWTSSANWERQLRYRGAREWARAHAPGTLLGIYTDDEMDDLAARNATDITPRQHALPKPKGPPPAPVAEAVVVQATPTKTAPEEDPFADPAAYLAGLDDGMAVVGDSATLDEVWAMHAANADGRLSAADEGKAEALYEKHKKRIA